jgi:hypothetical protein
MGLIPPCAGHRHLRIFEHRILARLLDLQPLPHTVAIGRPSCMRDVVRKAPQPLAQGRHAPAFARSCPVSQGVELCAELLTDRGRDGDQCLGQLEERVAQADAEARPERASADSWWCCRNHP